MPTPFNLILSIGFFAGGSSVASGVGVSLFRFFVPFWMGANPSTAPFWASNGGDADPVSSIADPSRGIDAAAGHDGGAVLELFRRLPDIVVDADAADGGRGGGDMPPSGGSSGECAVGEDEMVPNPKGAWGVVETLVLIAGTGGNADDVPLPTFNLRTILLGASDCGVAPRPLPLVRSTGPGVATVEELDLLRLDASEGLRAGVGRGMGATAAGGFTGADGFDSIHCLRTIGRVRTEPVCRKTTLPSPKCSQFQNRGNFSVRMYPFCASKMIEQKWRRFDSSRADKTGDLQPSASMLKLK